MSNKKDSETPSTTSYAYDLMAPRWDKMITLLGGTDAMRSADVKYLPKHPEEGQGSYYSRLNSNVLLNLTELTLESWVGRPFAEPVEIQADVPGHILPLLDDVDSMGNNVNVFCRNWFRDGVAKAFSHVWVDFSGRTPEEVLGRPRTGLDDLQDNLRPYWVHIPPEDLFFAFAEIIDSREVLTHIRWNTIRQSRVGFAEVFTEQIRSATLTEVFDEVSQVVKTVVNIQVFEWLDKNDKGNRVKARWVEVESFDMDINEIPLVTFYANRQGFMVGKPPLQDQADLNIRWWQSNSDQIAILTVSRFPILAASGVSDTSELTVGPNNWLGMEAPNGRFYYVEHEAKATGAGDQDLKNLEEQMGNYGADYLKKRPGAQTATARALDSAEATSPLQDVSLRFQDSVANVLRLTDKWMRLANSTIGNPNEADGGTANVITNFGPEEADQVHASLLQFARTNRDISGQQFRNQLKLMAALPADFPEAKNKAELEAEQEELLDMMASEMDLDPEVPDEKPKVGDNEDNNKDAPKK